MTPLWVWSDKKSSCRIINVRKHFKGHVFSSHGSDKHFSFFCPPPCNMSSSIDHVGCEGITWIDIASDIVCGFYCGFKNAPDRNKREWTEGNGRGWELGLCRVLFQTNRHGISWVIWFFIHWNKKKRNISKSKFNWRYYCAGKMKQSNKSRDQNWSKLKKNTSVLFFTDCDTDKKGPN